MTVPRPIPLAYFTDSLEPSGVGEVITLLSRALPPAAYRQILICPDAPACNGLVVRLGDTVTVRRLTLRDDGHVTELADLVAFLQQEGVQVFHNHIGATWEGDWGTLAARMAGVPVVVTTEHLPCVIERACERRFKHQVNCLADRVIAVSESVRQTLVDAKICAPHQSVTIRNGIDLSRFIQVRPPEKARELAATARGALIGTIGRMTEQKGHIDLLRAVPAVITRHPEVRFVWLGDGPERAHLEEEAGRLGVQQHVLFLGRQPDAWRWLPIFAFTCLPSLFEGLPLAALESMAAGKAVVGARVCGTQDAVRHGETGLLVPARDPNALAAALLYLLGHPAEHARMGQRARQQAAAEFSVERMVREHQALYSGLLARRLARSGPQPPVWEARRRASASDVPAVPAARH
jgi:glycosyltransferase involved in cell wall biosynthesis